ncbi:MAG: nucleotidyltransferase domain-containing protein [Lentimicrobium sp.]|nr:nucleotidyltransferase domain-containing protein [Lentimicrobium sp.]
MKESTNKILNLIKDNVSQIDPHAEIILYGSRARGDEKTDSDWDILILIDDEATFERERTFRHHLYDLELNLGEAFSVFVFNKVDWNARFKVTDFYQNVVNEGIAL